MVQSSGFTVARDVVKAVGPVIRADGTAGGGPINGSRWTQVAVLPQPWLGRASSFSFGSCGRRQRRAVVVVVVVASLIGWSLCFCPVAQVQSFPARDAVLRFESEISAFRLSFVVGADILTKCRLFSVFAVVVESSVRLEGRLCFWQMSDKRLRKTEGER